MIIHTRDLATHGPVEKIKEMSFSISKDENDEEFAMEVMSAQLYSNKLKIIAQEYLSNARDAHREAGKANIPVKVHLPTSEEPWYEVTDFGHGISPENFESIFLQYFASTKRGEDSTSKRQNGGFGLGAKCAWSYAPEFFVTTTHNEIEYRYHCYRNEHKKRKAALLSQSRISKHEFNGTTVRVNILKDDILLFNGEFRYLTMMWGVKPEIVNYGNSFYEQWVYDSILYEDSNVVIFSKTGGVSTKLVALVDDIPYPIDVDVIKDHLSESEIHFAKNACGFIHCDKLRVDPTPNRENLEYNNRTTEYIASVVKSAYDAVSSFIQDKIDTAKNYWEACCIRYNAEIIHPELYQLIFQPKYNGIRLPDVKENSIDYRNSYRRMKERTQAFLAEYSPIRDDIHVCEVSSHKFNLKFPFVFQIGGAPDRSKDKLKIIFDQMRNSHEGIMGFNLVRLPSESESLDEVIRDLEKKFNWSHILKYDFSKVVIEKPKRVRGQKKTVDEVYEICFDNTVKRVKVDFKGRFDVYIPIKNKTVTILDRNYRYDECNETLKRFAALTGIDFTQVRLFAIPNRFVKKMSKFKTMRSFDSAINAGIQDLKSKYDFNDVINRYKINGEYGCLVDGIGYPIREIFSAVKTMIDPNSVFARVGELKCNGHKKMNLTQVEVDIIWYLRTTGYDFNSHNINTTELDEVKKLIKIYNANYDTLWGMMSCYGVKNEPKRLELFVSIVNMIEGKINMSL